MEAEITSKLRDQLGAARNANEMFRIFAQCNALFVRPRIRSAIQEYQSALISRVKVRFRGGLSWKPHWLINRVPREALGLACVKLNGLRLWEMVAASYAIARLMHITTIILATYTKNSRKMLASPFYSMKHEFFRRNAGLPSSFFIVFIGLRLVTY